MHNLDSQVMDSTVEVLSWSIPIYDAVIVMPGEAVAGRTQYATKIDEINKDRTDILADYFDSIGIKQTNGAAKQWKKLQDKIVPIENFKCQLTALK